MKLECPSILDKSGIPVCHGVRAAGKIMRYLGPGFFVTVGFIDPGNWATNIAAGSHFNYSLLWVVALSTMVLILWQHMSAHLGIITGKCLAEAVSEHVRPPFQYIYGLTAMAASIATALAEILGAALGLYILFHIPVKIGALIGTGVVIYAVWRHKYSALEKVIVAFVSIIGLAYLAELYIVKPDWAAVALHTVKPEINSQSIIIAMGVLGAVVMPHNMYLHSEVIQNRKWQGASDDETRRLLRYEFVDTLVAMLAGMAINAAMVIVAAAVFFKHGVIVSDLVQASATLQPIAGKLAGVLFGIALLFAGISSSITAGMAGGTIFSGYTGKETSLENPEFRTGVLLTILPACLIILLIHGGFDVLFKTLIWSQVCLSIQLPFTMIPLFLLTRSRRVMGKWANGWLETTAMVVTGLLIIGLNILLIYRLFGGSF